MPLVQVARRGNQPLYQGRIARLKRVSEFALGWTEERGVHRQPAVGLEALECAVERANRNLNERKRQAEDGALPGVVPLAEQENGQRNTQHERCFLLRRINRMRML